MKHREDADDCPDHAIKLLDGEHGYETSNAGEGCLLDFHARKRGSGFAGAPRVTNYQSAVALVRIV